MEQLPKTYRGPLSGLRRHLGLEPTYGRDEVKPNTVSSYPIVISRPVRGGIDLADNSQISALVLLKQIRRGFLELYQMMFETHTQYQPKIR